MSAPGALEILKSAYSKGGLIGEIFIECGYIQGKYGIPGAIVYGIMTGNTMIGKTYAAYFAKEKQTKNGRYIAVPLREKNFFSKSRTRLDERLEEFKKNDG